MVDERETNMSQEFANGFVEKGKEYAREGYENAAMQCFDKAIEIIPDISRDFANVFVEKGKEYVREGYEGAAGKYFDLAKKYMDGVAVKEGKNQAAAEKIEEQKLPLKQDARNRFLAPILEQIDWMRGLQINERNALDFCRNYSKLDAGMVKEADENILAFLVMRSKKDVNAFVGHVINVSEQEEAWPVLIKLLEMTVILGKATIDCNSLALAARSIANESEGSERFAKFTDVVGKLAATKQIDCFFNIENELRSKDEKLLSWGEKSLLRVLDRSPAILNPENRLVSEIRQMNGKTAGLEQKKNSQQIGKTTSAAFPEATKIDKTLPRTPAWPVC